MSVAIAKFVAFNSVLPLFDMGTDLKAFFFYMSAVAYHPYWAYLTLLWIAVPFVIHLSKFLYFLATTGEADWNDLFLHIPFVLPLRNLCLAYRLFELRFGMPDFDTTNWAEVEAIQKKVAKDGLSESYFESGPQAELRNVNLNLAKLCVLLNFLTQPLP